MGKVAVMGAGSWGTAFAMMCIDAGEDVVLWARRAEVARGINDAHRNPDYLTEIDLPQSLVATDDAEMALADAEIAILAVPSHALADSLSRWRGIRPDGVIAASLVKGIALERRQRASEVIAETWAQPESRIAVVSGPNLALECARRMPGGTVVASADAAVAERVQRACHTPYFRAYTNADVVGVELGGAVKNALAIAAGIADGLGYGDNTKALLITRGLAEMTRLGLAMGGAAMTFAGMAGMGDLVATCMSRQSRNRHVGESLGSGRSLEDTIEAMNMVAEGVKSSPAILALAETHGVEMPIVREVVRVIEDGAAPRDVAAALMGREPKDEFHSMPPDEQVPTGAPA